MYTKVLLLVFVALPLLVSCGPTYCERWKGSSQFRCSKDGYGADRVHIGNIANTNIAFKVGKWMSTCGWPGVNYSDQTFNLGHGGDLNVDFSEAAPGKCNELFVYDCKRDNTAVNCLDVVSVYPLYK